MVLNTILKTSNTNLKSASIVGFEDRRPQYQAWDSSGKVDYFRRAIWSEGLRNDTTEKGTGPDYKCLQYASWQPSKTILFCKQ